jgi:two-component system, chemotaxis family, sensor kinase Cph1
LLTVDLCQLADGKHQVTIRAGESPMVFADRNRIEQVLCNLLTNAFKYSPQNTGIEVVLERLDDSRTKVSVSDQGIGIPEDKIEDVFERFFFVMPSLLTHAKAESHYNHSRCSNHGGCLS